MGDLKRLAFDEITASINSLTYPKLVEEMFSVFTSRRGIPSKIMTRLLTYPVDIRNSMVSTSSDSDFIWRATSELGDSTLKVLLNCNYLVIFLGNFRTAGTFSHPYYRLSWTGPLPVTLLVSRAATTTPS